MKVGQIFHAVYCGAFCILASSCSPKPLDIEDLYSSCLHGICFSSRSVFTIDARYYDEGNFADLHIQNLENSSAAHYKIFQGFLQADYGEPRVDCERSYYSRKTENGGVFFHIYEREVCDGVKVEWVSGPQVDLHTYVGDQKVKIEF